MLDIVQLDPDWTLPSRRDDNPLIWMVQFAGVTFDVRDAPRHVQETALRNGIIPYLPPET